MDNIFNEFNLSLTDNQLYKFKKYKELLLFYNDKFNLTAIKEDREIYIKHFVDSILPYQQFKCGKFLDVGSGGGFPIIPLKIMMEEISVTMLEATGKKCEFLREVVKELDLKNAEVINGRAEELAFNNKYRENFDHVTARAVSRLNMLCELCLPFVKKGGSFYSYKGEGKEELLEAEKCIKILGGKVDRVLEYDLEGAKRCVIEIKKVGVTPNSYPRQYNKIKKNPL